MYDFVFIGGGFYSCYIAAMLKKEYPQKKIAVFEQDSKIMQRASYINQARVHNGYHYPRDLATALSCNLMYQKFKQEFPTAIYSDYKSLYAIARHNSNVSAQYFQTFFDRINSQASVASNKYKKLFDPVYLEEIFEVDEVSFCAKTLAEIAMNLLELHNVDLFCDSKILSVSKKENYTDLHIQSNITENTIKAKKVFNMTYSNLNAILPEQEQIPLKLQISEIALIETPDVFKNVGITIMDGAFVSSIPFPSENCHSLTDVRYTHHKVLYTDTANPSYDAFLENNTLQSNFKYMMANAQRFCPILKESAYKKSLYVMKAFPINMEVKDGRPILLKNHRHNTDMYSILGAKIDNVYSCLDYILEKVGD